MPPSKEYDDTVDMEKGSGVEVEASAKSSQTDKGKSIWPIVLFLVGLGAVVCAVTLPLVSNKSSSTTTKSTESQKSFASATGPFEASLPFLSPEATKGYDSEEQLKEDLTNVAKFFLNPIITSNSQYTNVNQGIDDVDSDFSEEDGEAMRDESAADDSAGDSSAAFSPSSPVGAPQSMTTGGAGKVGDETNSYGSNNQEEGVEEGDMIVSNGQFVFAAFGDSIVIMDPISGEKVSEITMPAIKLPERPEEEFPKPDVVDEPEIFEDTEAASARSSFYYPGFYEPKPTIVHLLLQGDRLMVIVQGYEAEKTSQEERILSGHGSTRLIIYKVVGREQGVLEVVAQEDIDGYFSDVRAIDGKAHIVTTSYVNTYPFLQMPIDVWGGEFEGMSAEEYVDSASTVAKEELIPEFVDRLFEEVSGINLFRISLMQSNENTPAGFPIDVLNTLVTVHSFDMNADSSTVEFVKSGAFVPGYGAQVYGSLDTIVISGTNWEWDEQTGMSEESTYLLAMSTDGASSTPKAVGKIEGTVMNSRAVDVVGNVLRVATIVRKNRWFFRVDVLEEDLPADEEGDIAVTEPMRPFPEEEEDDMDNYIITLNLDGTDGEMEEMGRIDLGKPNEGFTAVRFFSDTAYAVTFRQIDPLYVIDLSDPANPTKLSELEITGYSTYLNPINEEQTLLVGIGQEANETGHELGVMVSVFDVSDKSDPKVAQRYVVEKEDDTHSHTDANWDFMSIRYAAGRLVIPLDISDYDDRSNDFHGFAVFVVNKNEIYEECRINHAAPWNSIVPFPFEEEPFMEPEEVVSDADEEEVVMEPPPEEPLGEVTRPAEPEFWPEDPSSFEPSVFSSGGDQFWPVEPALPPPPECVFCGGASLARRSFIFQGNLVTTNGPTMQSTDMGTCTDQWTLDLSADQETENCCPFWY